MWKKLLRALGWKKPKLEGGDSAVLPPEVLELVEAVPEPLPPVVDLVSIQNGRRPRGRSAAVFTIEQPPPHAAGWLGPDGTFYPSVTGHGFAAHGVLDPGGKYDDARPYERELEQKRFVKLMINTYTQKWCRPREQWRLTRAQREYIAEWYTMRGWRLPDWLEAQF